MEIEESEDTVEVEDGEKNIENLEENKSHERRGSLFGLTKSRICESCERIEKCLPLGQSFRRCQACPKHKDLVEKKPFLDVQSEEMIGKERIEMDYDGKDKSFIVAASKSIMETLEEKILYDNKKILSNEIFPVEYECAEENVVKTPIVITSEERKVIKRKDFFFPNKKEYKYISALESTRKKENFGYSKGKSLLEKDTSLSNDKKEESIETLIEQRLKEEIELERREQGWIVNGRNASQSKVMPMKGGMGLDGNSLINERQEKVKVKEKLDTQRILGLVARRSESRITSPTHKRDPNKHRDDDVEAPYMRRSVSPSYDKKWETHSGKLTHRDNDLVYNDNDGRIPHLNINEEVPIPQPQVVQQIDHGTKFSSPRKMSSCVHENPLNGTQRIFNLLARRNGIRCACENPLYGTQRILDLLATRKGSRVNSPTDRIKEQNPSTKILLSQTLGKNCSENNPLSNNTVGKIANSNPNLVMDSEVQTYDNIEPTTLSNYNNHSLFSDNPLNGTHRVLELLARRSESRMTSPKDKPNYDIVKESLISTPINEFSKFELTMETNDIAHQSSGKENHENIQSKVSHLGSKIHNQNELIHKINEEDNKLKSQSKQDVSRKKSPPSNFSTSSSSICHVNDNPLYVTKFENESSSCSSDNANKGIEEVYICESTYNTQLKNDMKIEEKKNNEFKNRNENYKQKNNTFNTSSKTNMEILEVATLDDSENKSYVGNGSISPSNLKVDSSKNTSKDQTMFWPIHMIFRGLTYPFRLIWKLILYFVCIVKTIVFGITKPFSMLKNITSLGLGDENGCNISQGYLGCQCATKTYILIVLSSLLLPSLFDLDFHLVNKFIDGQVIISEALNFDYTKEHPTASVNFLPQQIISKSKEFFPEKEVMAAQASPPSHIYNIIVHLTVPESQYNHEIGMFQVVSKILSIKGHTLYKASRASILRYHSPPMKYMKNMIMGIPIVLGLAQESQTLSIRILESQNENELSPIASVRVDIEPKASHLIGSGVPEIYHGELQVIAHNPYLQEVAQNWVWYLYAYSGLALFLVEALLVLSCCRRIFLQKLGNNHLIEELKN